MIALIQAGDDAGSSSGGAGLEMELETNQGLKVVGLGEWGRPHTA